MRTQQKEQQLAKVQQQDAKKDCCGLGKERPVRTSIRKNLGRHPGFQIFIKNEFSATRTNGKKE
jgi:hypothetical protein